MTDATDPPIATGSNPEPGALPPDPGEPTAEVGEQRWPMAVAVVSVGVLQALIPDDFRLLPRLFYPLFLLGFLAVLIIGDPGRIDRQRRWLRVTTVVMIGLITLLTASAAIRLVVGILTKADFTTASQLLIIGACVWLTDVIAFALWYWDLDAGGAAARAAPTRPIGPAFVFPEMNLKEFVPAGWYPKFADYLALSFNTALAFSPTDVSAVRIWAKLMMVVQSLVSLAVAGLVIARAINIL